MTADSDLIARLRQTPECAHDIRTGLVDAAREAADALEAKDAEIATLRADRDRQYEYKRSLYALVGELDSVDGFTEAGKAVLARAVMAKLLAPSPEASR